MIIIKKVTLPSDSFFPVTATETVTTTNIATPRKDAKAIICRLDSFEDEVADPSFSKECRLELTSL